MFFLFVFFATIPSQEQCVTQIRKQHQTTHTYPHTHIVYTSNTKARTHML